MNYMTIEPRIAPRGSLDAAVALIVSVGQLFVLLLLAAAPAYLVKILTHNSTAVVLTFWAVFLLPPLLLWLFVVRRLRCDEDGLEFVRTLGSPKKIPWASVESIEEAPQREVVIRGWLWPRFPPRELTACMTSVGHYRIRWQGGTAYFPPRDVARFLYAIQIGRDYAARQHAGAIPFPWPHSNRAPAKPPTTVEVSPGLPYHQLARNAAHRWWRPLVGSAGIVGAVLGVGGFLLGLETVAYRFTSGQWPDHSHDAARHDPIFGDAALDGVFNSTATSILVLLVLSLAIFGMAKDVQKRPPGTLISVAGRLRGNWLGLCFALVIPVGTAVAGFMLLFDAARGGTPLEGPPPELFNSLVLLIAIVAVQELMFRGWILQAVGAYTLQTRHSRGGRVLSAVFQTPWPAILVSATLSTFAYDYVGAGKLTLFAFGVIAGWVTVRTGGLEASLALAWVYLAGVFGLGLTTEPDDVRQIGAHIGAMLLFAVAAVLFSRLLHIQTVTIPAFPAPTPSPNREVLPVREPGCRMRPSPQVRPDGQ